MMLRPPRVAWIALVASVALIASAGETVGRPAPSNPVLGHWARSAGSCVHPEFVFEPTRATIRFDADGSLLQREYPAVSYRIADHATEVDLGRSHPVARTPRRTELRLEPQPDGSLHLARLAGRFVTLQRCEGAG